MFILCEYLLFVEYAVRGSLYTYVYKTTMKCDNDIAKSTSFFKHLWYHIRCFGQHVSVLRIPDECAILCWCIIWGFILRFYSFSMKQTRLDIYTVGPETHLQTCAPKVLRNIVWPQSKPSLNHADLIRNLSCRDDLNFRSIVKIHHCFSEHKWAIKAILV